MESELMAWRGPRVLVRAMKRDWTIRNERAKTQDWIIPNVRAKRTAGIKANERAMS